MEERFKVPPRDSDPPPESPVPELIVTEEFSSSVLPICPAGKETVPVAVKLPEKTFPNRDVPAEMKVETSLLMDEVAVAGMLMAIVVVVGERDDTPKGSRDSSKVLPNPAPPVASLPSHKSAEPVMAAQSGVSTPDVFTSPVPKSEVKYPFDPSSKKESTSIPVALTRGKVDVAEVDVAWKYGAAILVYDSRPPEKEEVAVFKTKTGRDVVGARDETP